MAIISGAEILIESLVQNNVKQMFGHNGGAIMGILDQWYLKKPFKFLLLRQEGAVTHAADGYARATGIPGVCLVTSGPGAINALIGIATAHMDSIPMIVISGQVKTNLIGNDAFQEADMLSLTDPISKHNFLVESVANLSMIVKEAFHIAITGRPGPVIIDLPVDVSMSECEYDPDPEMDLLGYNTKIKLCYEKIRLAMQAIKKAKKPLFYAGGGILLSNASKEFTALAQMLGVPVTTTLMGLGCFPEDDELSLGMLGMHGLPAANMAVQETDCLIALGARFDDRVAGNIEKFAPNTRKPGGKIIHIDVDPSSINKNVIIDIDIVGDAKKVIREMLKTASKLRIGPWRKQIKHLKKKYPLRYKIESPTQLKPQYILEQLSRITNGNAIIVHDVGQHQMWAAQFITHKKVTRKKGRDVLSSGGLGTMGFGLPAAIGAQIGCPNKTVILVTGDGSIQMNSQEMATVHAANLPIKIVLLNNGYLGMVRQWQELFSNKRYAQTFIGDINPNFVAVARAYGLSANKVTSQDEIIPALHAMLETAGPVLLDFCINPEENVMPMVPAGRSLDEMIGVAS